MSEMEHFFFLRCELKCVCVWYDIATPKMCKLDIPILYTPAILIPSNLCVSSQYSSYFEKGHA